MSAAIVIENAYLAYQQDVLLNQLNLKISANKITCLLGKSGVGKSTLLRLIAGLVTDQQSTVFRGRIVSEDSLDLSNSIAYMAQSDLLLPWLTAYDNACLGNRLRNTLTQSI